MEMHIVHLYPDRSLGAVLGIFFDVERGTNDGITFIESLEFSEADSCPGHELGEVPLRSFLESLDLTEFWSYDGSLTTPVCTEGIKWTVLD